MSKPSPSLNELIKEGKSIWVQNTTNPLGIVSLSLDKEIGCTIPKSKEPVDLTLLASLETINKSTSLRKLLLGKALRLLTPEDAARASKDLKDQVASALKVEPKEKEATSKSLMGNASEPDEVEEESKDAELNVQVLQLVENLRNKKIKIAEALKALANLEETLSEEDFSYISSNCSSPSIKKWCLERLNKRNPGGSIG